MNRSRSLMWLNYRRGPSLAVPAPFDDGDATVPWWYDKCATMAAHLASVGITDVLFPNPVKTQSGAYRTGDGYGPYGDLADIGTKNQCATIPTRFGTGEQLLRAIAIMRANGIEVHIDHVMHQISGGRAGNYTYLGADGKTKNGRWPKFPSCFRGDPKDGRVPEDDVPSEPDDFAFGDQLCYVNGKPYHYNWDNMLQMSDMLFRRLHASGCRLDDMKGINIDFIKAFLNYGAMKGKFFFGEYASGNRNDTEWWVNQVDRLSSAADFDTFYNVIHPMLDKAGSGSYHVAWGAGRGMLAIDPLKSVTFVESMDSDSNGWASIVFNKELGYAFLLTSEGLPQVYVRDYLREPDCYGLQKPIDNLCWIHSKLANGDTVERYGDASVRVYERTGDPGLLVALNNGVFNPEWPVVTVQTNFGPNVQLHDYTGHNDTNYWTDSQGKVTIWIPPGADGHGYSCWSRVGLDGPVNVSSYSTTQTFFGADDLDIAAIDSTKPVTVGRIWCATHCPLTVTLDCDRTGWQTGSTVSWSITDSHNNIINTGKQIFRGDDPVTVESHGGVEGWHTIVLTATAVTVRTPYELTVTYTAPKNFKIEMPPRPVTASASTT